MINVHKINNNIYITSDEPIKIDDWYLTFTNKEVMGQPRKCEDANWDFSFCKKIILTTDQNLIKDGVQSIDDDFLEWFVKNPSCEKVKVSELRFFNPDTNESAHCKWEYDLPQEEPKQIKCYCGHTTYCDCGPLEVSDEAKQRAANYMSLKGALESKQETVEEAAENWLNKDGFNIYNHYDTRPSFIAGAKWQQERMYSEEELIDFADYIRNNQYVWNYPDKIRDRRTTKELFEQFKKK